MNDVQTLFDQMQSAKKEQKDIRKEYRDALSHDSTYQQSLEDLKVLRDKKKLIESEVQSQMGNRWERMDDLKREIANAQEMISDATLNAIMKGESIAIKDEYDTVYEPQFNVTFKKADGVRDFQ
ncbi:MAG: hypothetical protein IPN70_00460 [Candidatus Moraniibacteriota bacterium]|nr:MAG: hypothetical protein IPN70_00460 [Candidatus Moranbacteria bacterium]